MISMKYHQMGGHLPNEEQQLLIKATILEKNQALSAWQAWKKRVDTNHIDPGSFKLIPLLFRQLTSFGIEDPLLTRYKSVYRSIWYRNQLLIDHSSQLIQALNSAGIQMITIFGLPMVLHYYKDIGSRIIDSVFLQIFPGQSGQATKVVRDIGWFPASYCLKPRNDYQFSVAFRISRHENKPKEFGLNITQHPSPFSILYDPDDPLWKDSLRIEIIGSSLSMLNPTDFLFYTCIHGIEWKSPAELRWIIDAYKILAQEESNINWSRLLEQTQEKRVVLPIKNTFAFLLEAFYFPIPNFVIHSLETFNKQSFYQNEYSAIIAPKSIINNFRKKWFQYARSTRMRNKTAIPNFFGFLEFIKSDWQLINVWEIPFEFLKRGRRFLSK